MDETTIICPLRMIGNVRGIVTGSAACIQGHCAWWNGHDCAMLSLAVSFGWLNNNGVITWPEKEADI